MRQAARLFEAKDLEAIERDISGIAAVAPTASRSMLAISGDTNWSTVVTGVDNAYLRVRDWSLARGRVFTDGELRAGAMGCILGDTVRQKLFGAQDPLDATIRLGALSCPVIGVLAAKGQAAFGIDQDDLVLIPLRAYQRRIAGNQYIDAILVSVRDGVSTKKVQGDIELLLRERRHLGPREEADFHVLDMQQIVATVSGTTRTLTALLGAVAAVSLLVGGIGIMNIMLVSVTERTREIGIRLAIGATENEVLLQFLVEAVMLVAARRHCGHTRRRRRRGRGRDAAERAVRLQRLDRRHRVPVLRRGGRDLRVLSRAQGGAAQPDRRPAARVRRGAGRERVRRSDQSAWRAIFSRVARTSSPRTSRSA